MFNAEETADLPLLTHHLRIYILQRPIWTIVVKRNFTCTSWPRASFRCFGYQRFLSMYEYWKSTYMASYQSINKIGFVVCCLIWLIFWFQVNISKLSVQHIPWIILTVRAWLCSEWLSTSSSMSFGIVSHREMIRLPRYRCTCSNPQ